MVNHAQTISQARRVRALRLDPNAGDGDFRDAVAELEHAVIGDGTHQGFARSTLTDLCSCAHQRADHDGGSGACVEETGHCARFNPWPPRSRELAAGIGAPPTEAERHSMKSLAEALNRYEPPCRTCGGTGRTPIGDLDCPECGSPTQDAEPTVGDWPLPDERKQGMAWAAVVALGLAAAVVVAAIVCAALGHPWTWGTR